MISARVRVSVLITLGVQLCVQRVGRLGVRVHRHQAILVWLFWVTRSSENIEAYMSRVRRGTTDSTV